MAQFPQSAIDELCQWCDKLSEPDSKFQVTSPQTWVYNCIAFAMGSSEMWVASGHPNKGWYSWWPTGIPRNSEPQSLIEAFQSVGFELCEDDLPEDGYDKVVLYRKFHNKLNRYTWTHAARVVDVHELHSKIGASYDIHHRDGDIFENCSYGEEYAFMRRPVSDRSKTIAALPTQCEVQIGKEIHMLAFNGATLLDDKIIATV